MGLIETGIRDVVLREMTPFNDARGWLAEAYRMDEQDHVPVMAYTSVTLPGVARGPHEHLLQTDLFIFAGPGAFMLHLYDNRPESPTHRAAFSATYGADRPASIIIPPRVIHAYRCVSDAPGLVINLPNKLYKGPARRDPVDEIRHEDNPASPFYEAFEHRLFEGGK